jgi:drug/metabolite transporter (DMT)-like permease
MNKNKLYGKSALLTSALLWGLAFVAVQEALNEGWTPFILLGFRGLMAGLLLGIFALKRQFWKNKALMKSGMLAGAVMFIGFALQTYGQQLSTVSNASFITVLYVVFVPLLMLQKRALSISMIVAVLSAVVGTAFLTLTNGLSFHIGDILLIGCAFAFACHIIIIDRLARFHDALSATVIQVLTMSGLGFIFSLMVPSPIPSSGWLYVGYAGIISSGLAFVLQIYGQRHVDSTVAGLLLTMEALFGALGAIFLLHEPFKMNTMIGASFMMMAVILIELSPMLIKKFKGDS